jgi:hypothetical protein
MSYKKKLVAMDKDILGRLVFKKPLYIAKMCPY